MSACLDPTVVTTDFPVRYAETDAMGVVHHAAYLVYFEEGRSQYMREMGHDYANIEAKGFRLPVSEIGARYSSSARYGHRVGIRTWIEENRSRSVTFRYEVIELESKIELVNGFTKHIWTNIGGSVIRAPDFWFDLLKAQI